MKVTCKVSLGDLTINLKRRDILLDFYHLISDYLTDHKQQVEHRNMFSSWQPISKGISPGINQGPLLFNIFMNDLPYIVPHMHVAQLCPCHCSWHLDLEIMSKVLTRISQNDSFSSGLITWNDILNKKG